MSTTVRLSFGAQITREDGTVEALPARRFGGYSYLQIGLE